MEHKNFDCFGNVSPIKQPISNDFFIKNQIKRWQKINNKTIIAQVFRLLALNKEISINIVKEMFGKSSYIDLSINKSKTAKSKRYYLS